MGHFAVHCAISGVPISSSEEMVIGFHLTRTHCSRHMNKKWAADSLPVRGYYDGYGRIVTEKHSRGEILLESEENDRPVAICDMGIWNYILGNKELHSENKDKFKKYFQDMHNAYEPFCKMYKDMDTNVRSQIFFSTVSETITKIKIPYYLGCLFTEGKVLREKILEIGLNPPEDNQVYVDLEVLASMLILPYISGRLIEPSHGNTYAHAIQDTSYKEEADYFSTMAEITKNKMRK